MRCQNLTSRVEVLNLKFLFALHRHHEQYSPAPPALLRCPPVAQIRSDAITLTLYSVPQLILVPPGNRPTI